MSVNTWSSTAKPKEAVGKVRAFVAAAAAVSWFLSSDDPKKSASHSCPTTSSSNDSHPVLSNTDSTWSDNSYGASNRPPTLRTFLGLPLGSAHTDRSSTVKSYSPRSRSASSSVPRTLRVSGRRYRSEFQEIGKLGSGAYGSVYQSRHLLDGNTYAIKKIVLPFTVPQHSLELDQVENGRETRNFLREAQIMAAVCKHRNIVRYHQSWLELQPGSDSKPSAWASGLSLPGISASLLSGSGLALTSLVPRATPVTDYITSSSEDSDDWNDDYSNDSEVSSTSSSESSLVLYIQMEYCAGASLFDWLRVPGRMVDPVENYKLFKQLICGLEHLHSKGYCHRDVKPANLLIVPKRGRNKLKVGDFGCCKRLTTDSYLDPPSALSNPSFFHTQGCGTFYYMAPELHTCQYDEKVDIFAAGVVLFELFNVFYTEMERRQNLTFLHEKRMVPYDFVVRYPQEANLVLRMTDNNPKQRPSAFELLNDPKFGLCCVEDLDPDTHTSTS